ncbi:hypothetical protein PCE1_001403 [Barthelona sp. PCE]
MTKEAQEKEKKLVRKPKNLVIRIKSGFIMLVIVGAFLYFGPTSTFALCSLISVLSFLEMLRVCSKLLSNDCSKKNTLLVLAKLSYVVLFLCRTLVTMAPLYPGKQLTVIVPFVPIIRLVLLTVLLSVFVYNLRRPHYKQMLIFFSAITVVLLLVHLVLESFSLVFSCAGWFFASICMVQLNDIGAYLVGATIGRTKYIEVSPNKSLEGFIGGFFFTLLFTHLFGRLLMNLCTPYHTLQFSWALGFSNAHFWSQQVVLGVSRWQFGMIILSAFNSFISPTFGYIGSGIKRVMSLDDFGDLFPGHGGVTDRFDCCFIGMIFAKALYDAFINHY